LKSVDEINIYIYKLWRRKCIELKESIPLPAFIREPRIGSILFLGMNPSLNKDGYKEQLSKSQHEWIRSINFKEFIHQDYNDYLSNHEILELVDKVNDIDEAIGKGGHIYIDTITNKIINIVGIDIEDCCFWDLFCFRGNNQDHFLDTYIFNAKKKRRRTQINLFGLKQIVILLRVIQLNKPKVIVLPNKGAADKLLEVFRLVDKDIIFGEEYGTHYIKMKGGKYPIFLSSNLHLRNRLDKFSQERLGWHVKWVYNQI
jgi:hypothetical protein